MNEKKLAESLGSPSKGWVVVIFTAPFLPAPFNIIIGAIGFIGLVFAISKEI